MAQIQPPETFDFSTPNEWPKWRERFERYLRVSGMKKKEEADKIDLFMYLMGDRTDDIFRTFKFEKEEEATKIDSVFKAFDSHFCVRKNIIYERAKFNKRIQEDWEPVDEFITSLYKLADSCEFEGLHEQLIRDRIVIGVRDKALSERMQLDSELTLEKAVKMVRQQEAVRQQQVDLQRPSTSQKVNQDELSVQNGLLMRSCRLFIPASMKLEILDKLHAGHFGITKTRLCARETVWWPGIPEEIAETVRKCSVCIQEAVSKHEPLIPTNFPTRPWQKIGMDLFKFENKWYLVVIDYYYRFPEMIQLDRLTANVVVRNCKSIFARHGIPETVVSDNGTQFGAAREFTNFARQYGFTHVTSSPRFPQSNGMAEAGVKIAKLILKKNQDPSLGLLEYRSTPLENGYSPAELLMGRKLRTTLPIAPENLNPKLVDSQTLKRKEGRRRKDMKSRYDRRCGATDMEELSEGHTVWITDMRIWGIVKQKASTPRSYMVDTPVGTLRRNRFHLRKGDTVQYPADPSTPTFSGEELVENEKTPVVDYPSNDSEDGQIRTRSGRIVKPVDRLHYLLYYAFKVCDWPKWIRRFERFRQASGLINNPENEQVNMFVYCMGDNADDILLSCKIASDQLENYNKVIECFESHFIPRRNIIYERARFNQRCQQEGEKVNEFITALHSLAEHCNFGMLHDELIRDRIVVGVRDRALSERMQLDTDLTLVKATLMAKQLESVKEQQSSLYQQDSIDQIKKMPNYIKETKRHEPKIRQFKSNQLGGSSHGCTRCGNSNNHDWKNCPAMNSYCSKCKKKGHYAKVCRSEAINEINSEIAFLGSVEDNSKKWIVPIKVNNRHINFKIDTGADVNVLPLQNYYQSFQKIKLEKSDKILQGPNGIPLETVGMIHVKLQNKGHHLNSKIYIVDKLKQPLLSGETSEKLNIVRMIQQLSSGGCGGQRGRLGSGDNRGCYNCGEEGHRKFECTKPARGGGRGRGQSRDGGSNNTCYNCGEVGHRKNECTNNTAEDGGQEENQRKSKKARYTCGEFGHKKDDCPKSGTQESGDEEESSDNEEEETSQKRKQAEDSEEEEVEAEDPPKKKSKKPKSKKKEDCYLTLQANRTMPLESARSREMRRPPLRHQPGSQGDARMIRSKRPRRIALHQRPHLQEMEGCRGTTKTRIQRRASLQCQPCIQDMEGQSRYLEAEQMCQKWFAWFKSSNFDLEDKERPRPLLKFEDEELEARLDEDPTQMQNPDKNIRELIVALSDKMEDWHGKLETKLSSVEQGIEKLDRRIQQLETMMDNTAKSVSMNSEKIREMDTRIEFLEMKMRENNLIFHGVEGNE
ncbi:K02A2.6-like, partial [Cordylochernes scorpioides]